MALYIEPPTGNISLQKLETFALKRLDFISRIKEARGDVCRLQEIVCDDGAVADSDCLIAGSAKDKVSHFMLRLLLGGDPETHDFFCRAETSLFDFHFSCMSEEEMNKFFNKVNSQLHRKKLKPRQLTTPDSFESQDISCILGVFSNIRQSVGSWKKVIELYMAQCSNSYFSVPFQCILQLQMHRRRHPSAFGDNLLPGITLEQVDVLASKYPLCMSILLRSLRQKHRLGHHARIQLTLFLKDLGLPVHHAIALWQREYSQPPGTDCRCSHNWQTDGRRYTYSIRHLYGLEGARRNYRGHSCESLQQRLLGCGEEGGCPFSHWDDTALSTELRSMALQDSDISHIFSLRGAGHFSAACQSCIYRTKSSREQLAMDVEECCVKSSSSDMKGQTMTDIQSTQMLNVKSICSRTQVGEGTDATDVRTVFSYRHDKACEQVSISSSPEVLHRADFCTTEEDGACVTKPVETFDARVTTLERKGNTMSMSITEPKQENINITVENEACVKLHERRKPYKRKCQLANEAEVHRSKTLCVSPLEAKTISKGNLQERTVTCFQHDQDTAAKSKPCRITIHETCLSKKSVGPTELKVRTSMSAQVPTAEQRHGSRSSTQCCDRDVCFNQRTGSHTQTVVKEVSIQLSRPVHYFQLSYQCMLENLKS
ncbi:uncharacterized protein [Littorina saxatilis]|uniref:uncharacterized protein isoform X2 n=1 Tax=Littorina saxatilis TaxID=31220 RepID=UPI0038B430DC